MDKRSFLFVALLTLTFFLINNFLFPPGEYSPPPYSEPAKEEVASPPPAPSSPEETFYVLENSYQQLVFSSKGGALAEINLPLKSPENPKSVVREIRIDKILQDDYPQQDFFPAKPYQTFEKSFVEPTLGGYYPLIRRKAPPQHYALAVLSSEEETPIVYTLKNLGKNSIQLEGKGKDYRVLKTISFPENPDQAPYCFDLSLTIEGNGRDLYLTSGIPEVEIVSGSSSPTLKYRLTRNKKGAVEQLDLPKDSTFLSSITPDWVCNSNGFLGVVLDPQHEVPAGFSAFYIKGEDVPTRLSQIDAQYNLYPKDKYPGYEMRLPLPSSKTVSMRVYAGPFASHVLAEVDKTYKGDYAACISFHGWFSFISEPFAKFLFFLMKIFYAVTRSWGLSIILLTVALRLMLYPLNAWSIKSTAKMQAVSPKVAQLQEKYKKDPKKAQTEIMQLYRSQGVNPLGGCFPLLIQMPFLIGMFDLLKSTFELRGVSFIPGWIDNLTAPDVVFSWNYPIWFFGNSFHLLPLLLGGVMYWQQKMSSNAPKDKKLLTDQQKQQQLMGNIMVIVFSVLFYNFPSGLNLYWLSSMLLGILQQWWIAKRKHSNA